MLPATTHGEPVVPTPLGPVVASGAFADVYAIDEARVLRRYRSGRDASGEVQLLAHVVAHGFPAPRVLEAHGPDLVMERLHGPTLLQAVVAGMMPLREGAEILADLHHRLHAIPAPSDWTSTGVAQDWAHATGGPVIAHLDLHPGNVILSDTHGPSLVDWANARTATAELDVALTALILAEVAVDDDGEFARGARALTAAFLASAHVDPRGSLEDAVAVRRQDPGLVAGERELVPVAARLVRELLDEITDAHTARIAN
ncbi:phosphotransferase [Cellulomonas soli]